MPIFDEPQQRDAPSVAYDPILNPTERESFWDTLSATVGTNVDEGSSISYFLNRELEEERMAVVKQMDKEGYDLDKYRRRDGSLNFNRLKDDTNYPGLKDDHTIKRQRQEKMDRRFSYATDVQSRGGYAAQFAGDVVSMGADPLLAGSMFIAAPAAALRGAVTAGQAALRLAGAEAAIGMATEIPIQWAVSSYKESLGREYGAEQIATSILAAGLFGGVVGGAAGGLSHYLRNLKNVEGQPPEVVQALETQAKVYDKNPMRPSRKQVQDKVVELSRASSVELRLRLDAHKAGEIEMDPLEVTVAEGLINSRAEVKRREAAGFEAEEVPEVLREIAPERSPEAFDNRVSPEYREQLNVRLDKTEAEIEALTKELSRVKGRDKKRKKKITQRIEGLEANRTDLVARLKEQEELDVAATPRTEVDNTATYNAREKERQRVAALNKADQAFIDEEYNRAVADADVRYLRKMQDEFNRLETNKEIPTQSKRASEAEEGSADADKIILEEANRNPSSELRAIQEKIDALEVARGCLNGVS